MSWHRESYRHYLAARGVKTAIKLKHGMDPDKMFLPDQLQKGAKVELEHVSSPGIAKQIAKAHLVEDPHYYDKLELIEQKPGMQSSVRGIPIFAEKLPEGRIYPVTPEDVKAEIERHSPEETRGLVSVRFVNPRDGEQHDAWAQYVRSKREVLIFSQPAQSGLIDGQDPLQVRKHIKEYVLPHELGHHEALYVHKITDKDLEMAEARADANVIGMDADDKDVKVLKEMRRYNASKVDDRVIAARARFSKEFYDELDNLKRVKEYLGQTQNKEELEAEALQRVMQKNATKYNASKVDLNRYAGTWKQESVKPEPFFQRGLKNVKATYTPRKDGTIKVVNTGIDEQGKVKRIEGVARPVSSDNRKLEVTFGKSPLARLFMRGDYNIKSIDKGYKRAVVEGGGYKWVLKR